MKSNNKPKIVVLGGGFAGLEAALSLRMRMSDQAEIVLVSDTEYFTFKPNTIYIPFGLDPGKLKFGLARPTKRKEIRFVQAHARGIDPISKQVYVDSYEYGYHFSYDYLVVATGAAMRTDTVPGLGEFAHTIWTPEEMLNLRAGFHELAARAKEGQMQEVHFVVPPNNKHSGPLYEMTLMLDTWLRRKKVRDNVNLCLSTYEESYVQAFGPRMHDVVSAEFTQRGIVGHTQYEVSRVEHKKATFHNGERVPFDLLVTFPSHAASTYFSSLPTDERGFLATVTESRQVLGYPDIYAVGDTADFPLKQAHLALGQASTAAEHLSAQLLGTTPRFGFDPTGMYVLEGLDKATFVQAQLRTAGSSDASFEAEVKDKRYRVGSSPLWRLGKIAVGAYLPWRFKAGNPFHSGAPWKGVEAGLKVMSSLAAR